MNPGDADDIRLDAARVLARLGVTDRQLRRMVAGGFPAPHYLGERRRWWLSEVVAWESAHVTGERPAAVTRGASNLLRGAP